MYISLQISHRGINTKSEVYYCMATQIAPSTVLNIYLPKFSLRWILSVFRKTKSADEIRSEAERVLLRKTIQPKVRITEPVRALW